VQKPELEIAIDKTAAREEIAAEEEGINNPKMEPDK
jgi:hypothetical protein